MKKIVGIIPARYASTRFPGKPLVDIMGKTMIQRTYEQSKKATLLQDVIVATDDEIIYSHVVAFGGKAIMTSPTHQSGTDRCAEVATHIEADVIINIQGDEPFIQPEMIDQLANFFTNNTDEFAIATLIKPCNNMEEINSPNRIKVAVSNSFKALYFSRFSIPFQRNNNSDYIYYKHIGMYAYTNKALQNISKLPMASLEISESLEQLRWLQNDYTIYTIETHLETASIDVPADLEKILSEMKTII